MSLEIQKELADAETRAEELNGLISECDSDIARMTQEKAKKTDIKDVQDEKDDLQAELEEVSAKIVDLLSSLNLESAFEVAGESEKEPSVGVKGAVIGQNCSLQQCIEMERRQIQLAREAAEKKSD